MMLLSLSNAAARPEVFPPQVMSPDLARALSGWRRFGADSWSAGSEERERGDAAPAEGVLRMIVDLDGTAHLFGGRAEFSMDDGRLILSERYVAGNITRFLAILGSLYGRAGYFGPVDVGVAVTGLKDALSSADLWGTTWRFGNRASDTSQYLAQPQTRQAHERLRERVDAVVVRGVRKRRALVDEAAHPRRCPRPGSCTKGARGAQGGYRCWALDKSTDIPAVLGGRPRPRPGGPLDVEVHVSCRRGRGSGRRTTLARPSAATASSGLRPAAAWARVVATTAGAARAPSVAEWSTGDSASRGEVCSCPSPSSTRTQARSCARTCLRPPIGRRTDDPSVESERSGAPSRLSRRFPGWPGPRRSLPRPGTRPGRVRRHRSLTQGRRRRRSEAELQILLPGAYRPSGRRRPAPSSEG